MFSCTILKTYDGTFHHWFVVWRDNQMAVTVKQIAKELDISFQLVSAVLNNKSYCRASKEKRKLILDTAAKMGYVPNVNARVLAGKSSFILGVLADLQAASPAAKILAQLEKVASLAGFRLLIGGFHNKVDDIISSYKLLKQHNVDGVFLISLDDLNYEKKLTDFFKDEKNIVVVRAPLMNQHFCVEVDLISAFNNIVNELTASGKSNIHYIGENPDTHTALNDRVKGFSSAFEDAPKRLHYISNNTTSLTIDNLVADDFIENVVKKEKIDALVIQDDLIALQISSLLQKHNVKIPQEVAIVGCNNEPFVEHMFPSLSSINFNEELVALSAMTLMQKSLQNESVETIKILPNLVKRDSFS